MTGRWTPPPGRPSQNDFLSPDGATWGLVGGSVTENNTVENIERLFKAATANDIPVFISPHYYYPTDHGWQFEGTLERVMHEISIFDRPGPLDISCPSRHPLVPSLHG